MIMHSKGTIECQESGNGPPVVFVPGSFSTGASWRNSSGPLSERYRTITTSLCGYGKTQERRKLLRDYMQDEMDVLDSVLAQVDAPVHIVAHSFGAWVVLAQAMRRSPRLLSLTLLETTAFNLLTLVGATALSQQVQTMVDSYFAAWRRGEPHAVRHVIDFYGGSGTFDAYPPPVQDKLITQTPTNMLDWESGYSLYPTLADLASVHVPVLVVYGSTSHAAMQACNQALVQHMPQARLQVLDGANHFMIGSHAAELGQLVEQHIRSVQA